MLRLKLKTSNIRAKVRNPACCQPVYTLKSHHLQLSKVKALLAILGKYYSLTLIASNKHQH